MTRALNPLTVEKEAGLQEAMAAVVKNEHTCYSAAKAFCWSRQDDNRLVNHTCHKDYKSSHLEPYPRTIDVLLQQHLKCDLQFPTD